MKYESPRIMALNPPNGSGWCQAGSGASLGGGEYMYCVDGVSAVSCISGSSTSSTVSYCSNGTGNTTPAEQCLNGGTVGNPPACDAGNGASG